MTIGYAIRCCIRYRCNAWYKRNDRLIAFAYVNKLCIDQTKSVPVPSQFCFGQRSRYGTFDINLLVAKAHARACSIIFRCFLSKDRVSRIKTFLLMSVRLSSTPIVYAALV